MIPIDTAAHENYLVTLRRKEQLDAREGNWLLEISSTLQNDRDCSPQGSLAKLRSQFPHLPLNARSIQRIVEICKYCTRCRHSKYILQRKATDLNHTGSRTAHAIEKATVTVDHPLENSQAARGREMSLRKRECRSQAKNICHQCREKRRGGPKTKN